ncbi:MAG TPA: RNA methyltransferase [Anaerolineales bacterium]|nr:RNA methyltransferase [Anaerolineales bacterium]
MESEYLITSSSNQVVKLARSLLQRKKRDESGLFLVEGIHLVSSLFEAGWNVYTILYSPELLSSDYGHQLVEQQEQQGTRCYRISPDLFRKISGKDNPQGIIAIAYQQTHKLEDLDTRIFQWGIAIVSPQDPGNVGTIIRTLESVGADGLILLDGGVDPYHPSCVRAGMGALFWKPILKSSYMEMASWAHSNGYQLIGTSAHAENDYRILSTVKKPCILLLGSEQKGLSDEQLNSCDIVVSLPMRGHSTSLNLSIAAGILMYSMFSE